MTRIAPRASQMPRSRSAPDRSDWWLAAGYAGLATFVVATSVLREPGSPSSLRATSSDHSTTKIVGTTWGLAFAVPLLTRRIPIRPVATAAGPVGLIAQAAGVALHAWSMRTLGRWYTATLQTGQQQSVVDTGPYRLIRHPGYLSTLMTWTGFALTSRNIPTLVLVPGMIGAAYHLRVTAEEALLRRELPGYQEYCRRTKRLVPFVW